jgi:ankyrin repeat protein
MSRDGDLQTIKLELAAHADVNATDRSGWSALMHAAQMGNLEAVRALVTAGADREAKNKDGETALMIARKRQQGSPALQEIVAALSKTR